MGVLTVLAPPWILPAPPASVAHHHWHSADSAVAADPITQRPGMFQHEHPSLFCVPASKQGVAQSTYNLLISSYQHY